ncbi:DUF2325 domain-containing protein [Bacillus marasmi]|uniref:DUF2325 domain-containing protein n=1 Tax=Bacillus marasmi TaxID=1926279 RepID=UPI0011CB278B|nr:DUF2325 domain-containing protein [Bacillus marasmi]
MRISKVKPDIDTICHYFDEQHQFHTTILVYFFHQQQQLRAQLIFPFNRNGNFTIEKIEVFHHEQWNDKKGNVEQYGSALAKHVMVMLLGNNIIAVEQIAKQSLEESFQQFVRLLTQKLIDLLKGKLRLECEINSDFLCILTRVSINDEVVVGKIATNVHFSNLVQIEELAEQLAAKYATEILVNVDKFQEIQAEIGEDQTVYVTTIPLINPVSEDGALAMSLEVGIQSIGYCKKCNKQLSSPMGSNIKINPLRIENHQDDLLILTVGSTLQCDQCERYVKKEKITMWEHHSNQLLAKKDIEKLVELGQMNKHQYIQSLLEAAVEHYDYFHVRAQPFWNAFSYLAIAKWEQFCRELTRIELLEGLRVFSDDVPSDASKESLLSRVAKLVKTEADKQSFWRAANEKVIEHYLRITVFGWELDKEIRIIGDKRAEFIFQYLPCPDLLKPFIEKYSAYFTNGASAEDNRLHSTLEKQQSQIRQLQQENGQLSEKLGSAYARIDELEIAAFMVEQENRNQYDLRKIHQLKGLIAELKEELARLSVHEPNNVAIIEEDGVELTEVSEEENIISLENEFSGKTILILGGYRAKKITGEIPYEIITHDARLLDPVFYDMLKSADIIVVLTRFISHRAMWEAKEFAILEDKEIYYSSFTNFQRILREIAGKKLGG